MSNKDIEEPLLIPASAGTGINDSMQNFEVSMDHSDLQESYVFSDDEDKVKDKEW